MVLFGDFLEALLRAQKTTAKDLHVWLQRHSSSRSFSTTSGVKEHLRQCKEKGLPAWQYPLISDIARFFDHLGERESAQLIRHIFLQQAVDAGAVEDFFPSQSDAHKLWWLVFPPASLSVCSEDIEWWRAMCSNGDYALYKSAMSLYQQFAYSAAHVAMRKHISLTLAQIANYHADYTEAYLICTHIENSWLRAFEAGDKGSFDPSKRETERYLLALQIKSTAVSNLFSFTPHAASKKFLDRAYSELERCLQRKWIDQCQYSFVKVELLRRHLRILLRLPVLGYSGVVDQIESITSELKDASSRECQSRNTGPRFAVFDTLARASAFAGHHQEEADHYFDLAVAAKKQEDIDRAVKLQQGRRVLDDYQLSATKIILLCQRCGPSQSEKKTCYEQCQEILSRTFKEAGHPNVKHILLSLFYLARYVDRVCSGQTSVDGTEEQERENGMPVGGAMRFFVESTAFTTQLQQIDRTWKRANEPPFPPDDSIHKMHRGIKLGLHTFHEHTDALLQAYSLRRRAFSLVSARNSLSFEDE
jgi:predicted nucleic acid-binding Zn ribbon protein